MNKDELMKMMAQFWSQLIEFGDIYFSSWYKFPYPIIKQVWKFQG